MLAERIFQPALAAVTVGLLDGQTQTGHLARFAPSTPDLTLMLSSGPASKHLAAERIAYVGFHKTPGDPPPLPHERRGALKLHLTGNKTFLVDPEESDTRGG